MALSSIKLNNFQAHKESIIDLSLGINVVIGSSDSGKTAVLRALRWCINNRPSGKAYISYWNRDKDGNPKEGTSVSVIKGLLKVKRERSEKFNGYDFGEDDKLEALKTDVPQEVSSFFNLSEVNIQKQMEAPFLLSESPAEIARFFNEIIHLDLIDTVLSKAELMRRRLNQDLSAAVEKEKTLSEDLKKLE